MLYFNPSRLEAGLMALNVPHQPSPVSAAGVSGKPGAVGCAGHLLYLLPDSLSTLLHHPFWGIYKNEYINIYVIVYVWSNFLLSVLTTKKLALRHYCHISTITLWKCNWQSIWKDTYGWQKNRLDNVQRTYAILSVVYTAKLAILSTDNKTMVK